MTKNCFHSVPILILLIIILFFSSGTSCSGDSSGSPGDDDADADTYSGDGDGGGDGNGSPSVLYRPYSFTKRLLSKFVTDFSQKEGGSTSEAGAAAASRGFLHWLEERGRRRAETKEKVGEWARRKGKVAAARSAGGGCSAVLCLDSGGMDAQRCVV